MKLGPIGGYIVTIGGYGAPLEEHRENTGIVLSKHWPLFVIINI